jgi:predicted amidophosphoribosyltransferase
MSYCVNCGSEVDEGARICADCGYDPNIKGRRIRPDRSSIASYAEVLAEAESISEKPEKLVCKSCFKSFDRSQDCCPNCSEKNSQKGMPAPADSHAKKYAAFTALALLAIILALSIGYGL